MKRLLPIGFVLLALVVAAGWALWPRGPQGLVLYSAVDYGDDVARAFTRATGIPVTVVDVSTGALLARVSAEGDRPKWTLAWFDGNEAAAGLDRAHLAALHTVPELPWTSLGRKLVPADGSYTPTGLTLAGAFTYRPSTLATPPRRWSDLENPALRGAIGMNNPAISGPMFPMLAGMLSQAGGWPAGKSFVLGLKANGLRVYPKNANTLAALKAGDIKLAITQSSAAWNWAAQDANLRVVLPTPAFALPSVIMVAAGTPERLQTEAERFIRFAMAPATQRLRMADSEGDALYWPLTRNAPSPNKRLPSLHGIDVEVLPAAQWGAREASINSWFSRVVVGQ
ncbi:MAG: extracellular solute-binding protein [Betaproteobacteria bacterium]|nr:extracellular solute-binding protein [Betaproteobacteria bacterium]